MTTELKEPGVIIDSKSIIERCLNAAREKIERTDLLAAESDFKVALYFDPENREIQKALSDIREIRAAQSVLPPLLINTLPKSGSIFIWHSLCKGLGLQTSSAPTHGVASMTALISNLQLSLVGGGFPDSCINKSMLAFFAAEKNGAISQDHFPASRRNLAYVNQYLNKLVVHIRDPRQAMLSQLHDFMKAYQQNIYDCVYTLQPPMEFYGWTQHDQIDWHIDNWLPLLVDWLKGWIKVIDSKAYQFSILQTRFQDMRSQPRQFFERILNFYEIDHSRFRFPDSPTPDTLHFRKGSLDEWRQALTLQQCNRATSMIPAEFFDRFEWTP